MLELVARPLEDGIRMLEASHLTYEITLTRPVGRKGKPAEPEMLYVVKQYIDTEGIYHIVAAVKLGKEVDGNGI